MLKVQEQGPSFAQIREMKHHQVGLGETSQLNCGIC